MEPRPIGGQVHTAASLCQWSTTWQRATHARIGVAGLGLLGILLVGRRGVAQNAPALGPGRLTVRPHEMATGTRTARAGQQLLDSIPNYLVYVPPTCVGSRRCPLVVTLTSERPAQAQIDFHRPLADKYGMIVLAPQARTLNLWDITLAGQAAYQAGAPPAAGIDGNGLKIDPRESEDAPKVLRRFDNAPDLRNIDAALKQVLRKYAIDPDKIAVTGVAQDGDYAAFLGVNNFAVFSRVVLVAPSGSWAASELPRQAPQTRFLTVAGLRDEDRYLRVALRFGQWARRNGIPIEQELSFEGHGLSPDETDDRVWRWLEESWAGVPAAPLTVVDSVVLSETAKGMFHFWYRFMMLPDSIRRTAYLASRKRYAVAVGGQAWMSVVMGDIPALAAQYPSVVAALQGGGGHPPITPHDEEACAVAFISAKATKMAGEAAAPPPAGSVLEQNLQFFESDAGSFGALDVQRESSEFTLPPVEWE